MINSFRDSNRFLSNFWPCIIMAFGREYKSVEHYFQAMKATTIKEHDYVRNAPTATEAKRRGHEIRCREDWDNVKYAIMFEALIAKFNIPELRKALLATGNQTLIEGNTWHDNTFGDCSCQRCKDKYGVNMLGSILMLVRSTIHLQTNRERR